MCSTKGVKEILSLCDTKRDSWKNGLVELSVPKLNFQSDLDLTAMLHQMGVTDAFQKGKADFSHAWKENKDKSTLSGGYVSKANQAATVKVDENGCSVASYTEIAITESRIMPAVQMTMNCNRPFILLVSDKQGIPLFVNAVSRIE